MQHDISELRTRVAGLKFELALLRFQNLIRKFNADQPRIPAGQSGGGQWMSDASARVSAEASKHNPARQKVAAKRAYAICIAQYEKDLVECRIVRLSACYAQAMVRRVACEQGRPIPPLNY